jgi:hypothetical protein
LNPPGYRARNSASACLSLFKFIILHCCGLSKA